MKNILMKTDVISTEIILKIVKKGYACIAMKEIGSCHFYSAVFKLF